MLWLPPHDSSCNKADTHVSHTQFGESKRFLSEGGTGRGAYTASLSLTFENNLSVMPALQRLWKEKKKEISPFPLCFPELLTSMFGSYRDSVLCRVKTTLVS